MASIIAKFVAEILDKTTQYDPDCSHNDCRKRDLCFNIKFKIGDRDDRT